MKNILLAVMLMFAATCFAGDQAIQGVIVVPATKYTTPASHPCNVNPQPDENGAVIAMCITADETHYKCSNKDAILLTKESGERVCMTFMYYLVPQGSWATSGTTSTDKK